MLSLYGLRWLLRGLGVLLVLLGAPSSHSSPHVDCLTWQPNPSVWQDDDEEHSGTFAALRALPMPEGTPAGSDVRRMEWALKLRQQNKRSSPDYERKQASRSQPTIDILVSVVEELKRRIGKQTINLFSCGCFDPSLLEGLRNQKDIVYSCADIAAETVTELQRHGYPQDWQFMQADVVETGPERAYDLVVVRHLLGFLHLSDGLLALRRVLESRSLYLLASFNAMLDSNDQPNWKPGGHSRPINLLHAPFHFPAPLCASKDAVSGNSLLGLWSLALQPEAPLKAAQVGSPAGNVPSERLVALVPLTAVRTLPPQVDAQRDSRLAKLCPQALWQTFKTCLRKVAHGVHVRTGDIQDMWIRDSAAQVYPYLHYVNTNQTLRQLVRDVLTLQAFYLVQDPYGNSYYPKWKDPSTLHEKAQRKGRGKWVATRNYEMDSGAYFFRLMWHFWKKTGELPPLQDAVQVVLNTWATEQKHEELSPYVYDELERNGRGPPLGYTGLTYTPFRPSDDKTIGYNIPGNMFALVTLAYVQHFAAHWNNQTMLNQAKRMFLEIQHGISKFGTVKDAEFGEIYCYEVDGLGQCKLMDDANIPSLLAVPYLDPFSVSYDADIYERTKRFLFSPRNPFYFVGKVAKGIGSEHTKKNHVWHMSLIVEALLSPAHSQQMYEKLDTILRTTTGSMHEGFDVSDPNRFTRSWFAWPDALFAEGPWCDTYVRDGQPFEAGDRDGAAAKT
eukprot:g34131.t1